MGRMRHSGPMKSVGGFEIGAAASGWTAETNTTAVDSSGNLYQAGTQITATAAELNAAADNSAQAALVTPSAVITATAASIQTSVVRTGDIIKTMMVIDITGLKSSTTDLDIIGDTGVCYIGRVTTAINGVVFAGQMGCAIVPTTGADDIDLYSATEATGAYDAGVAALTETALVTAGGAHAIGTVKPFTAVPAANQYLYLTGGEGGTAGTYDAGTLIIEMWGTVA